MLSKNVQADILSILKDNKVHTAKAIAELVECSTKTVYRHIQSLSYRFNIETFKGGVDKGGVRLVTEPQVSVERLNVDDLQVIVNLLNSLQTDNVRIKSFINKLVCQKEIKEMNDEKIN